MYEITLAPGMTFVDTCPCCGGDDIPISQVITIDDKPHLYCSICADCGVSFLNPRMTEERTSEYYQGEYRDKMNGGVSVTDMNRQMVRSRIHIANVKQYGITGKSALEVGCSAGYMLHALNVNGFDDCVGVEPDTRYHDVHPARNFRLYTDIAFVPQQPFDLVVMLHSLEHINKPLDYLRNLIDRYAHDKTYFLIEVPNIDHNPNYWIHHPINFNAHSLNGLFERLGCKQIASFTHGMSIIDHRSYLVGIYQ